MGAGTESQSAENYLGSFIPANSWQNAAIRFLARRRVAEGRVVFTTIVIARPHPSAVLRRNRHLEDTADELATSSTS